MLTFYTNYASRVLNQNNFISYNYVLSVQGQWSDCPNGTTQGPGTQDRPCGPLQWVYSVWCGAGQVEVPSAGRVWFWLLADSLYSVWCSIGQVEVPIV